MQIRHRAFDKPSQNLFRLTEPRGMRFFPASDVLPFLGLFTLHQTKFASRTFQNNNRRSRQAA